MNISELRDSSFSNTEVSRGALEYVPPSVPIPLPNFDEAARVLEETRKRVIVPLHHALTDLRKSQRIGWMYHSIAVALLIACVALPIIGGVLGWPLYGLFGLLFFPSVAFGFKGFGYPSFKGVESHLEEYLKRFYSCGYSNSILPNAVKRLYLWQKPAQCLLVKNWYTGELHALGRKIEDLREQEREAWKRWGDRRLNVWRGDEDHSAWYGYGMPSFSIPSLESAEATEHERHHDKAECCTEAIQSEIQYVQDCFQRVMENDFLLISAFQKIRRHGEEGLFQWMQNPLWVQKTMLEGLITSGPNSIVQECLIKDQHSCN